MNWPQPKTTARSFQQRIGVAAWFVLLFAGYLHASAGPQVEGEQYVYMQMPTGPDLFRISLGEADCQPSRLFPDGLNCYDLRVSGTTFLCRTNLSLAVGRLGTPVIELHRICEVGWGGAWHDMALDPGGEAVLLVTKYVSGSPAILRYDMQTHKLGEVAQLRAGITYGCMSVSPQGRLVAIVWSEDQLVDNYYWCTVALVDIEKGTTMYLPISLRLDQGFQGAPVWSPGGNKLMICGDRFEGGKYQGRMTILDVRTNALSIPNEVTQFGGWFDEETFLALPRKSTRWARVDLGGSVLKQFPQDGRPIHLPGSRFVLAQKGTQAEPQIELWDLEGNTIRKLPPSVQMPYHLWKYSAAGGGGAKGR